MSDAMERLSTLAREQLAAEQLVAEKETELQQAKAQLQEVSERVLPSIMEELELEEFTTQDGLKIRVQKQVFGSISEANRAAAFRWLRDHGHGGIIKSKVEAAAEDQVQLQELLDLLRDYPVRDVSSVHHQTLGKWVREMQAEGSAIPPAIAVSERTVTKVTLK